MDAKRFDTWTRNRALRIPRRDAFRLIGTGGVAAALPVLDLRALAQGTCSLAIQAETAAGPSAPATYDGILRFTLRPDGSFTQATFTPANGAAQPVSGQAIGRAIDLQITLAVNRVLELSGTSEQPVAGCQGASAGIFSGPQPGDIGAWQTLSGAGFGSSSGSTAPPPVSGQSGSVSNEGTDSGGSSGGGSSTCLELQSQCNASAECCSGWCTDNECRTCGDTICGEDCVVLSDNLAHCGACFNACNVDTETCAGGVCTAGNGGGGATCLPDGEPCVSSTDCCSKGCTLQTKVCGCAQLGQSCSDDDMYCCEGTPVVCFGACCILNGFACSADADCCEYIQGSGSCTNGICTRTA